MFQVFGALSRLLGSREVRQVYRSLEYCLSYYTLACSGYQPLDFVHLSLTVLFLEKRYAEDLVTCWWRRLCNYTWKKRLITYSTEWARQKDCKSESTSHTMHYLTIDYYEWKLSSKTDRISISVSKRTRTWLPNAASHLGLPLASIVTLKCHDEISHTTRFVVAIRMSLSAISEPTNPGATYITRSSQLNARSILSRSCWIIFRVNSGSP